MAAAAAALPPPAAAGGPVVRDRCQAFVLLFAIPYLNEIKDSWEFAAVPLHFLAQGWPIWLWGFTIAAATLLRLPVNAAVTRYGDWLMAPLLAAAAGCAAYMLARPMELPAVMLGVAAGHCMDTCQAEHSLCYRWCEGGSDDRRKHRLRWQAASATAGYSTGALFGGTIYELGGFRACAVLQFSLCCSLALLMGGLPVVHGAFRARRRGSCCGRRPDEQGGGGGGGAEEQGSGNTPQGRTGSAPDHDTEGDGTGGDEGQPLALRRLLSEVTGRCYLPVSLVLLCDGLNIFAYVTEWALFSLYYKQVFNWSSTLTGAAQMAGDLLAAGILALTTTQCWATLTRKDRAAVGLRRIDRMLLQPPWNLGIFFVARVQPKPRPCLCGARS